MENEGNPHAIHYFSGDIAPTGVVAQLLNATCDTAKSIESDAKKLFDIIALIQFEEQAGWNLVLGAPWFSEPSLLESMDLAVKHNKKHFPEELLFHLRGIVRTDPGTALYENLLTVNGRDASRRTHIHLGDIDGVKRGFILRAGEVVRSDDADDSNDKDDDLTRDQHGRVLIPGDIVVDHNNAMIIRVVHVYGCHLVGDLIYDTLKGERRIDYSAGADADQVTWIAHCP